MGVPVVVTEAMGVLGAAEVSSLELPEELRERARLVGVVRGWVDAELTALAARAEELAQGAGVGAGGEHTVRGGARLTGYEAGVVARRVGVVREFGLLGVALREGRVTGEHVDVVARVAPTLSPEVRSGLLACEEELVVAAERVSPESFARQVRALVGVLDPSAAASELEHLERQASMRWWRGRDGSLRLAGTFAPLDGAAARAALDQELAKVTAAEARRAVGERRGEERLRAEAVSNLINGGHGVRHPGRSTLVVHVGIEHLVGEETGGVAETSGGQRLPIGWVREMAMRAEIVPVVLDRDAQAVELSRTATSRLATFVQRVLLRSMYATCVMPGCEVPFDDCEIHHVEPFDGRNTTLSNLVPACGPDHRRVHRDGWHLGMRGHGDITVHLPDGNVLEPDPPATLHPPDTHATDPPPDTHATDPPSDTHATDPPPGTDPSGAGPPHGEPSSTGPPRGGPLSAGCDDRSPGARPCAAAA